MEQIVQPVENEGDNEEEKTYILPTDNRPLSLSELDLNEEDTSPAPGFFPNEVEIFNDEGEPQQLLDNAFEEVVQTDEGNGSEETLDLTQWDETQAVADGEFAEPSNETGPRPHQPHPSIEIKNVETDLDTTYEQVIQTDESLLPDGVINLTDVDGIESDEYV